ncbi:MFS transporter [Siccirubricoccus sp. KC 17139]|uniref:MFS transporter n=1 Tax=Siccirubricoccus soli TaxID=2899147 RepID=A0ABT1D169_9PROT|nr:MFS transporter [Siccirubricoccus soli]MCO6415653.1 MFS transporter [Siccirubricoccus soli]MCP2681785.1 MFS transporter [Siccirubricoccus soli]
MSGNAEESQRLTGRMRRNLLLLACCQAIGQAGNTMMASATALSVISFYANRDLATLPMTLQHLGVMLSAFPAGLLMQRFGRRVGFKLGSICGMVGAVTISLGLYHAMFPLMCLGGFILGYAVASLQMYRFAAVELAPPAYRAKTISWVTAGGVAAGILGPSIARLTHDQMVPLYLATYASMFVLHLIVFTLMSFIEFPPPPRAAAAGTGRAEAPPRPLREIAAQPRFVVAVTAAMMAYGVMSFLMSASPLAIVACGMPHAEAHWVIFLHVMGMFVPSFFTGALITRFGETRIMALGLLVLALGVGCGLAGISAWHFRLGLMLNGVGWNFLFVGATALVTTCYRPNERGKTQSLNDFLIFGTTATASFLAGLLQEHLGWFVLNWFSLGLLTVVGAAIVWLALRQPRRAVA